MISDPGVMATARQENGFVEITFSSEISPNTVEAQVDACRDETCECCTPAFRDKVDEIATVPDEHPKVRIYGTISRDEVLENMASCVPKLAESE
jgi:hypothetical protein